MNFAAPGAARYAVYAAVAGPEVEVPVQYGVLVLRSGPPPTIRRSDDFCFQICEAAVRRSTAAWPLYEKGGLDH
jgi:hypothetical protein